MLGRLAELNRATAVERKTSGAKRKESKLRHGGLRNGRQVRETQGQRSYRTNVDGSGRIVLPSELRQRQQIHEGDTVVAVDDDHGVQVKSLDRALAEAQDYFATLAPPEVQLSEEVLADRRREAELEERCARRLRRQGAARGVLFGILRSHRPRPCTACNAPRAGRRALAARALCQRPSVSDLCQISGKRPN